MDHVYVSRDYLKSYESGGDPGALRLSILGLRMRSYGEGSCPRAKSCGAGHDATMPLVRGEGLRVTPSRGTPSSGSREGPQGSLGARRLFILRYLRT